MSIAAVVVNMAELPVVEALLKLDGAAAVSADQTGVSDNCGPPASTRYTTVGGGTVPVPRKWIETGDVVPLFGIVRSTLDALAMDGMKLSVTVVDCPGA